MRRPPGPKPRFLIGNLPLAAPAPLETFAQWAAEYGDIFYYRAAWLQVYFLNRPDLIDYVLVKNPQNFLKDRVVQNSRWLLGSGLLTAEGDDWKRQRRLIQPAFSRERLAAYAQCMTEAAGQMLAGWRPGAVVDIHQEMMRVTLRVVVRALFESETAGTEAISRSLNTVMQNSVGIRLILPGVFRYLPLRGMSDVRHAVSEMNSAVYEIIRQRRGAADSGARDLLSILMNAHDDDGSRMSDEQLRDEVMTFLLAGHETTTLALSWAFYLLSQHPEPEAKLHEEVDRLTGEKVVSMSAESHTFQTKECVGHPEISQSPTPANEAGMGHPSAMADPAQPKVSIPPYLRFASGRTGHPSTLGHPNEVKPSSGMGHPAFSDMSALTYTESVIKETMRLYPPAWSVARTAINDFELDWYRIPAGANIVMSQWIMHRDARFFPEPEKFDPARWGRPECQNLPRFAYFPFGGGPRQCIGASFAMTEAVLILATIARRFRLVWVDQAPVQPVPSLTLRPKQGIRMRIEER
jgi:cytochrome P450